MYSHKYDSVSTTHITLSLPDPALLRRTHTAARVCMQSTQVVPISHTSKRRLRAVFEKDLLTSADGASGNEDGVPREEHTYLGAHRATSNSSHKFELRVVRLQAPGIIGHASGPLLPLGRPRPRVVPDERGHLGEGVEGLRATQSSELRAPLSLCPLARRPSP
jgi:hypothetical protein